MPEWSSGSLKLSPCSCIFIYMGTCYPLGWLFLEAVEMGRMFWFHPLKLSLLVIKYLGKPSHEDYNLGWWKLRFRSLLHGTLWKWREVGHFNTRAWEIHLAFACSLVVRLQRWVRPRSNLQLSPAYWLLWGIIGIRSLSKLNFHWY